MILFFNPSNLPLFNSLIEIKVVSDLNQTWFLWFSIAIILFSLSFFLVLKLIHRKKEKYDKILDHQSAEIKELEKALLSYQYEIDQFQYITSHNLKEPLSNIQGFASLIKEDYAEIFDEDGKKALQFIQQSGEQMKALLDGLLQYSLIGKKGSCTTVSIKSIIDEVLNEFEESIKKENIEVRIEVRNSLKGVEEEFKLLFYHLITNAITYRSRQRNSFIHINELDNAEMTRIVIKDNGIGIPELYHDRVFTIFQKLHTKDKFPGTGLGLALCKKIVQMHMGNMYIDSAPDQGTEIILDFPK